MEGQSSRSSPPVPSPSPSPPSPPSKTSSSRAGDSPPDAPRRTGMHNDVLRPVPPPKEDEIRPLGQGHTFTYAPKPRPADLPARSSSSSQSPPPAPPRSRSRSRSIRAASVEDFASAAESPVARDARDEPDAQFALEELADDYDGARADSDSDGGLSVIRPDQYEDAHSERATSAQSARRDDDGDVRTQMLADDFEHLDCYSSYERGAWLRQQRLAQRKNRLSLGSIHKRTFSQSIGSDTDDEDIRPENASEAGSSASGLRRLRRKTGDRSSLLLDDSSQRIVEMDEPDSEKEDRGGGPDPEIAGETLPDCDTGMDVDSTG